MIGGCGRNFTTESVFSAEYVVVQLLNHVWLHKPMNYYIPEFAQTHVYWLGDAIQLSHPLLPLSPPAIDLYGLYTKQTVQRQYNPHIWNHNLHMCICVITHTVLIIKHRLYLWHGTYSIYGTLCTVYDISPTIYDITTLYPLHQFIISHIKLIIASTGK